MAKSNSFLKLLRSSRSLSRARYTLYLSKASRINSIRSVNHSLNPRFAHIPQAIRSGLDLNLCSAKKQRNITFTFNLHLKEVRAKSFSILFYRWFRKLWWLQSNQKIVLGILGEFKERLVMGYPILNILMEGLNPKWPSCWDWCQNKIGTLPVESTSMMLLINSLKSLVLKESRMKLLQVTPW